MQHSRTVNSCIVIENKEEILFSHLSFVEREILRRECMIVSQIRRIQISVMQKTYPF